MPLVHVFFFECLQMPLGVALGVFGCLWMLLVACWCLWLFFGALGYLLDALLVPFLCSWCLFGGVGCLRVPLGALGCSQDELRMR